MMEYGYGWEDGLLIHVMVDDILGEVKIITVPNSGHSIVLKLAHDGCGHGGYRKVLDIIRKRFV